MSVLNQILIYQLVQLLFYNNSLTQILRISLDKYFVTTVLYFQHNYHLKHPLIVVLMMCIVLSLLMKCKYLLAIYIKRVLPNKDLCKNKSKNCWIVDLLVPVKALMVALFCLYVSQMALFDFVSIIEH